MLAKCNIIILRIIVQTFHISSVSSHSSSANAIRKLIFDDTLTHPLRHKHAVFGKTAQRGHIDHYNCTCAAWCCHIYTSHPPSTVYSDMFCTCLCVCSRVSVCWSSLLLINTALSHPWLFKLHLSRSSG